MVHFLHNQGSRTRLLQCLKTHGHKRLQHQNCFTPKKKIMNKKKSWNLFRRKKKRSRTSPLPPKKKETFVSFFVCFRAMQATPNFCPTPFSSPVDVPLLRPISKPHHIVVMPHMADLHLPLSAASKLTSHSCDSIGFRQQTVLQILTSTLCPDNLNHER